MILKKRIYQAFGAILILICIIGSKEPVFADNNSKSSFSFRNIFSPPPSSDKDSSDKDSSKIDISIAPQKPIIQQINTREHKFTFSDTLTSWPEKKPLPKSIDIRLKSKDRQLYKEIFTLQKQEQWDKADIKVKKLSDMRLIGYVAYQRYTHPQYNSSETELRNWLNIHGNYAGAYNLYKMANIKFNTSFKKPKKQKTFSHKVLLLNGQKVKPYNTRKKLSLAQRNAIKNLKRSISDDLGRDSPTNALKKLNNNKATEYMDNAEEDIIRADIAAAYFYLALIDKAAPIAMQAANRSGSYAPLAGWIAGLSAWHKQDYKTAAYYFETAASAKRSSNWMKSAASYWAARSYVRGRSPQKAVYWLKNASLYPRSFYGLIAMQSLGIKQHSYDWSTPQEKDKYNINSILKIKNGYRTVALLDAGQPHLAMEEMRRINLNSNNTKLKESLFILASRYNMPGMAMQLASTVKRPNGKLYDSALYPTSPWQPKNGFTIYPSLIHAFIRQESRFNPYATSRSGAMGLMQLMPTTASYIAKKPKAYFKSNAGQDKLLEPILNITLGQKYLAKLLKNPSINDNLFKLAAAYNAGPGRLARWKRKMSKQPHIVNDSLLFIEMMPASETRAFVEQVMANYWIYNLRFYGQTPNSLKSVASGKWPLYTQDSHIELSNRKAYLDK